jgi:outer membrane immunogenic protein
MKSLILAAAAVATLAVAAPAMAQDNTTTLYGSAGYTNFNAEDVNLGAIQARLSARFDTHFGLEGEIAAGIVGDDVSVLGTKVDIDLNYQAGVYAVGYLPVGPNADIFARVGYVNAELEASVAGASGTGNSGGMAYGVGGQYFFTEKDGVRIDYTRHEYEDLDADVIGVSYVRKF